MNNLNKFTKAELISKLEKTDIKKESNKISIINQINTYLSQIFKLILTFKDLLVKLTFISLVIRIFKNYKIFRKLWTIFNIIVMSIFSISLIDNFGLSFLHNLLEEIRNISTNIIDYLSNSRFYNYLEKLFSTKEDLKVEDRPSKTRSLIESNKTETIRNENKIGENKNKKNKEI